MRGTPQLRRRFRGLGELRIASGTSDSRLVKLLDAMLLTLFNTGRLDILRAIKARRLRPLEVWEQYRAGKVDNLPSEAAFKPLGATWERWAPALKATPAHRRDVGNYGKRLAKLAGKMATVRELPAALLAFRVQCDSKPVTFNRARAAAQAFLRDTVGRRSDVYGQVVEIGTLKAGSRKVMGGLSPQEAIGVARALPRSLAGQWLAMCVSGMGPGELEGAWEPEGDGLRIHGTKRESRDRLVPWLLEIPRPRHQAATLRKALRKHQKGLTPYVGRRTFAHWMEEAGIPRARRRLYMGHAAGDVTDLYEGHDVKRFLPEDAGRLRTYLAPIWSSLTDLLTDVAKKRRGKR